MDGDGVLTQGEFHAMLSSLAISGVDTRAVFRQGDAFGTWDRTLTLDETHYAIESNAPLRETVKAVLHFSEPERPAFGHAPNVIVYATDRLTCEVSVDDTSLNDLPPLRRFQLGKYFATVLGVGSPLALKMNFLTTRTGKGGSPQVLIKATAFYLSPAKALAANASVQANLDTVAKARAALSLNVFRPVVTGFNNTEVSLPPARVSLSERYVGDSYLWVWSDGLMAVLWSVLGAAILSCVATCAAARKVAKRRRQKLNAAYVGCVTSGCCSVYTLRFYGCLVVIASAVVTYIMSYVNDHVTIVIGKATELLEQLDEIALLEGPAGDAAHVLPPSDIDSIRGAINTIGSLVVGPGVAAFFMVCYAGCCVTVRWKATTYRLAKGFACLGNLVILLLFAVFFVLAAIGACIEQPIVKHDLALVQNTCDATLPDLEQAVADADNALANAVASGLSRYLLVDYEKAIDTAKLAFKLYGRSCSAMDAMFDSLHVLLTPSLIGLGILAWAFYVINGLICAAGCHRNSVPLLTGGAYGRLRFSSTKFGLARVTPGRLLRKKESGGMEMVMDPV